MVLGGSLTFAKAYCQHLDNAALMAAAEIGVWLDPGDRDHGIGFPGVLIPIDGLPPTVGTDLDGGHVGSDRDAQIVLGYAVRAEKLPLSLGRAAAMATHGSNNERLGAPIPQCLQRGTYDRCQIRDAAAAYCDRNTVSRP